MDFNTISTELGVETPYGSKINNVWFYGYIPVKFLNENFGHLSTAQEMINTTESEGLKLFLSWLRDEKGILA